MAALTIRPNAAAATVAAASQITAILSSNEVITDSQIVNLLADFSVFPAVVLSDSYLVARTWPLPKITAGILTQFLSITSRKIGAGPHLAQPYQIG